MILPTAAKTMILPRAAKTIFLLVCCAIVVKAAELGVATREEHAVDATQRADATDRGNSPTSLAECDGCVRTEAELVDTIADILSGTLPADTEVVLCRSTKTTPLELSSERIAIRSPNFSLSITCCGLPSFDEEDEEDEDDSSRPRGIARGLGRRRRRRRQRRRRRRQDSREQCKITRFGTGGGITVDAPGAGSLTISNIEFTTEGADASLTNANAGVQAFIDADPASFGAGSSFEIFNCVFQVREPRLPNLS